MNRIFFFGLANGEFCAQDCPQLIETTEGVPKFVLRAYPNTKNYVCKFFGILSGSQQRTSFKIHKPKRAVECLERITE